MSARWFGRVATFAVASSTLVAIAACDPYYDDYGYTRGGRGGRGDYCANPARVCRTYCYDYCDYWGYCYPSCSESCVDECDDAPSTPSSPPQYPEDAAPPPAPIDGGAAVDASVPDPGAPLCSPCATNSDCQEGALCIFYGVPSGDAGATSASFCGSACTTTCPSGFTCATLGTRQQCVPTSGRCQ